MRKDSLHCPRTRGHLRLRLLQRKVEGVRVLGPAAAPNSRLKRIYRYHLVLKSDRRDVLGAALRELLAVVDREEIPRRCIVVDVDPMHLM